MPRGNVNNLINNADLTPEQRKASASKAGKASAAAKKERRNIAKWLDYFAGQDGGELPDGTVIPNEAIISKGIVDAAKKQDWKAVEIYLKMTKQMPKDGEGATASATAVSIDVSKLTTAKIEKLLNGNNK